MRNIFHVIFFFTIFFASCDKETAPDCFKKTGKITDEEYVLDAFKKMDLYDHFNVHLVQSDEHKVVVKGGKNLLPKIKISVRDSILSIHNENTCNFVRGYEHVMDVYVYFVNLEYIQVLGQINLTSEDTIRYHNLKVQVKSKVAKSKLILEGYLINFQVWNGTGDFILQGKTFHSYLLNSGTGYIWAEDLKGRYGYVENESTGDMEVFITDTMAVKISSIGDIYYKGSPKINLVEQSSSGKLIKK